MSLFRKKNHWRTILYSRVMLGVLLALCVLMAFSVYERYKAEREMMVRRSSTDEELKVLRTRKSDLEEKVDYINGERGAEEEIRKYFDVAKEGEQVVIILDDKTELGQSTAVDSLSDIDTPKPFWATIFSW